MKLANLHHVEDALTYLDFLLDDEGPTDPQKQRCAHCMKPGLYYDCRLDVLPRMWFLHGHNISRETLFQEHDDFEMKARNRDISSLQLEKLNSFLMLHSENDCAIPFYKRLQAVFPKSPRVQFLARMNMILLDILDVILISSLSNMVVEYFGGGTPTYLYIAREFIQVRSRHSLRCQFDIEIETYLRWCAWLHHTHTHIGTSMQYLKLQGRDVTGDGGLPMRWEAFPDDPRFYSLIDLDVKTDYDIPQFRHAVYSVGSSSHPVIKDVLLCRTCLNDNGKHESILFETDNKDLFDDLALDWIRDDLISRKHRSPRQEI